MTTLNPDQQQSLTKLNAWYHSSENYAILQGPAGVGKTFVLDTFLKGLRGVNPILIAPTHEALRNLREKVTGDYPFRTVHSSLGVTPTTHMSEIRFEHAKLPALWNDVNLAVVDEAGMEDDWAIELYESTGCKVLHVGHKSQLPPIKEKRPVNDPCASPVFLKDYLTVNLRTPVRNSGALWEFTVYLEELIYNKGRLSDSPFDVKKPFVKDYIHSNKGKEALLSGDLQILMWTNDTVNRYNRKLRKVLFGEEVAQAHKYVKDDRVLLTKPLTVTQLNLENELSLEKRLKAKEEQDFLYANTHALVQKVSLTDVRLNNYLFIPCYKINLLTSDGEYDVFEPIHKESMDTLEHYYNKVAFGKSKQEEKHKVFRKKHFIMSCFANLLHSYAGSTHRVQGKTIKKVIVVDTDINKNPCVIERKKCMYVACSRASHQLFRYRGL